MKKRKEEVVEFLEEKVEEPKKEAKEIPEFYATTVGDTYEKIAKKFGISEEAIKEINDNSYLFPGIQIKLK